ncbi:MAG TPA: S-methyl-5-thioribose-1-phosphate isomerase [Terriglobia bacterium]|nr:S-methyl-5-thioribose-1-phosphate isomerase [Terriglobia bacterium]
MQQTNSFKTIEWTADGVRMIDQTQLPAQEVYRTYSDYQGVADAIRSMVIRGAPAIGVAAAMGVALGIKNSAATSVEALRTEFETVARTIGQTRPTAVNLFWAIERMRRVFEAALGAGSDEVERIRAARTRVVEEARRMLAEDIAVNEAMGRAGAALMPDQGTILTHCNAGALATGGYGTALGVIRAAVEAGKQLQVFADETRPFLQGARLTAWELARDGIPVTVITDNMAGHFMKEGKIAAVIVGADRIAANGDVANKIGTYSVAVLARENGIPFYVAAPLSTIDLKLASGDEIPIEERSAREVTHLAGVRIVPEDVEARHPAFDVTPHRYLTAIVTERGVAREPYTENLAALFSGNRVIGSVYS